MLADERTGTAPLSRHAAAAAGSRRAAGEARGRRLVDLGKVTVERRGKASLVTMKNPRFLNAEDETTLDLTEIAVDLAILDPATEIAVLRGGALEHPQVSQAAASSAAGSISRISIAARFRSCGSSSATSASCTSSCAASRGPSALPDDVHGHGIEKPWIAAVDGFAIGGHCQILLTMDYVLAASDAFMTLPARKEGIIPGLANLRLPRFTGDRIARQAIQYERKLVCDSPDGRLICDEIAKPDEMDAAIERVVDGLTNAGAVSAIGNRRAFRVAQEPLDLFRRYCSAYARDQAYCCFSPALIANLERNWDAHNRKT